jgi:hypothetical protein
MPYNNRILHFDLVRCLSKSTCAEEKAWAIVKINEILTAYDRLHLMGACSALMINFNFWL